MGVCHVSRLAVHSLLLDEDLDYAFLKFQVGLLDHEHKAVQMKAHQQCFQAEDFPSDDTAHHGFEMNMVLKILLLNHPL